METLPLRTLVCNAAAVFQGLCGAVTRQAQEAGCGRQTVYKQARLVEHRLDPATTATEIERLRAENQRLRLRLELARQRVEHTARCDPAKLRRVATVAFADGVSPRQIERIFATWLDDRPAPRHATIGRWVDQEAHKDRALLRPLDAACVPLVSTLAGEESLLGAPTLVGVEPHSLTALLSRNAPDRSAATWRAQLRPWGSSSPTAPRGSPGPSPTWPTTETKTPGDPAWGRGWTCSTPETRPRSCCPGRGGGPKRPGRRPRRPTRRYARSGAGATMRCRRPIGRGPPGTVPSGPSTGPTRRNGPGPWPARPSRCSTSGATSTPDAGPRRSWPRRCWACRGRCGGRAATPW